MIELAACLSIETSKFSLADFKRVSDLLSQTESPREAARLLSEGSLARDLLESDGVWQRALDVRARCLEAGFQILYPGHPDYPVVFFDLPQPPLFISLQGQWPSLPRFSIVGSREPSRQAVEWMREYLPEFHRKRAVAIVSGGARGVDQLAHISAMEAERPTIVLSPAGLLKLYPRDLNSWREIIVQGGGAIVSEFAPLAEMHKHHFLRRNRLIAALSPVTFVVEARRKSGSLLTARTVLDLDRQLCVLPGSPLQSASQGTTDLMFDGAQPIRDAHDLVQYWDLVFKPNHGEAQRAPQ